MKTAHDYLLAAEAARLREAIAGISAQLKGPGINDLERRILHEERRDMRLRLAEIAP